MAGHSILDDDETWMIFEPLFLEDATAAEKTARLWQAMITELDNGEVTHVRNCLETAIRLYYPYTESFRESRDTFEASIAHQDDE